MKRTFTPAASLSPILRGALLALRCSLGQIPVARSINRFDGLVAGAILLSNDLVVRCLHILFLSVLAISILSFSSVVAQSALTGGLTGVVSDADGAVVSNVTVEITNERTRKVERNIKSEADGSYSATLLPPGTYSLRVAASNFKQSLIAGVQLRINETSRQDVKLEVGDITETVEIVAAPSLTNPVSPVMGQSIDAAMLERLPLASPNPLFLLSLSSGTAGDLTDVRTLGRANASITVNGGRTSNNSISLEGINVSDFNLAQFDNVPLPNPDVLQEFKVATSLYDASQGGKGVPFHPGRSWRHGNRQQYGRLSPAEFSSPPCGRQSPIRVRSPTITQIASRSGHRSTTGKPSRPA